MQNSVIITYKNVEVTINEYIMLLKQNISTLDLSNHRTDFDDRLLKLLTNLTILDISDNDKITDKSLKFLTNLRSLHASNNIKITDNSVKFLTNLTFINLGMDSKITDKSIKLLKNLTSINLEINKNITNNSLINLTNIVSLNLYGNKLITDNLLKTLTNISYLNLEFNDKITDNSLKLLTNMTYLNLNVNKNITDKSLGLLKNLTFLELVDNENISDKSVSLLTNLTFLNLSSNIKITTKSIVMLTNIKNLDLTDNKIISKSILLKISKNNSNSVIPKNVEKEIISIKSKSTKNINQQSVITITFGERVENHARMQMIGDLATSGFSINELKNAKKLFESKGATCELISLNTLLSSDIKSDPAAILIIRNGVSTLGLDANNMMNENLAYNWDKHALMRGKVVNKHARWNVCIADYSQEPLYEDGKGRVINFTDVPITEKNS